MKFYTISYCKFGKTFEVYPRLFTKRKDAEEFCVFLRSSGHSNVKITVCTLQCKYAPHRFPPDGSGAVGIMGSKGSTP